MSIAEESIGRASSSCDTTPTAPAWWPIGTNPDVFGSGCVAGVAVLDDGMVGLVLTSGDLYDGNLWLEVFDPDGLHVSAVTAPGRKTMGVTGRVDTFVVSSDEQIDAYTADGAEAWSSSAEIRGLARPCTVLAVALLSPLSSPPAQASPRASRGASRRRESMGRRSRPRRVR